MILVLWYLQFSEFTYIFTCWWEYCGYILFQFHILSRKLTSAKTRNVTVPLPSLNWLLSHFPSDPYQFPIHHDAHATLPAPLLSDLLIKYELLHPPSSNVTRTQFSTPSPATWSKCRVAAPKIWAHQGVIKSESGHICTTSSTLDSALRATRSFWQDFPSPYHSHWTELLSFYASRVSPVPHCSPPNFDAIFTKQSPHLLILRQVLTAFPLLLGAWPLRSLPTPLPVISMTFKPSKPELLFSFWSLSPKRIKVITLITIVRSVYQTPAIG